MLISELINKLYAISINTKAVFCHPDSGAIHEITNVYLAKGKKEEIVLMLSDEEIIDAI